MDISPALATPLEVRDLAADERLAAEARSDPAAFGLIYERHVERVFGFLRARGAPEDLASDLTATTFERALGHIGRYRPGDAGIATLEKAAVDVDRIWVAVAISSDQIGADDVWDMRVVDANGVAYTGGTGAGTGEVRGAAALLFGFQVPDGVTPAGPFALEITSLDVQGVKTPGAWHFTFDAPLGPRTSAE